MSSTALISAGAPSSANSRRKRDGAKALDMAGRQDGAPIGRPVLWQQLNLTPLFQFYGRQARPEEVPAIKAPLLLQFAQEDARINATWPEYEAALKAHGKTYEAYIYPGTQHGFHNDSTPRYDEAAAQLSWERTLAWFARYLH